MQRQDETRHWYDLLKVAKLFARRRLRLSADKAEDASHEAILVLLRQLRRGRYDTKRPAPAFLRCVLGRHAVNDSRRQRVHTGRHEELLLSMKPNSLAADPETAAWGRQAANILQRMPEKWRQAWLLRHLDDLSVGEISARLQTSERTIYNHLESAENWLDNHVRRRDMRRCIAPITFSTHAAPGAAQGPRILLLMLFGVAIASLLLLQCENSDVTLDEAPVRLGTRADAAHSPTRTSPANPPHHIDAGERATPPQTIGRPSASPDTPPPPPIPSHSPAPRPGASQSEARPSESNAHQTPAPTLEADAQDIEQDPIATPVVIPIASGSGPPKGEHGLAAVDPTGLGTGYPDHPGSGPDPERPGPGPGPGPRHPVPGFGFDPVVDPIPICTPDEENESREWLSDISGLQRDADDFLAVNLPTEAVAALDAAVESLDELMLECPCANICASEWNRCQRSQILLHAGEIILDLAKNRAQDPTFYSASEKHGSSTQLDKLLLALKYFGQSLDSPPTEIGVDCSRDNFNSVRKNLSSDNLPSLNPSTEAGHAVFAFKSHYLNKIVHLDP